MKLVFRDQTFSFELLRAIGYTVYDGADIGECLATAARIKEGDFESWHTEWTRTAQRVQKIAEDCVAGAHTISARKAYPARKRSSVLRPRRVPKSMFRQEP